MPGVAQLRVADVCAHDMLASAELVAVDPFRNAPVSGVDLVLPSTVLEESLSPHGIVALALDGAETASHRGHLIDVVLRRAATSGSSLLVVVGGPRPVPEATRRLAAQLPMPLVLAGPEVSSTHLVVALREAIATPLQPVADIVLNLSRRLRGVPRDLEELVENVQAELPGSTVYACAGGDLPLAGTPRHTRMADVVRHRAPAEMLGQDWGAAVHPIEGLNGEIALWLVAERTRVGKRWLVAAAAALSLAGGPTLAWLARRQSMTDRHARMRSALLTELLEDTGMTQALGEQAAQVGWTLDGWHTGLHVHLPAAPHSGLTIRNLAERLRPVGLGPDAFVERTDGWSAWVTTPRDPGPEHPRTLARRLERLLGGRQVVPQVIVGIGSPQRDREGIRTTLAEARQAALIAATSPRPVSVRVLQEVGPSRLLLGWYSSDAFADYARELLGPLLDSQEPEVLRTLEAYLERACSVSQTARALDVHRNTVAQRIAKAERLLGTTTATADTRLALQLALRVLRARSDS